MTELRIAAKLAHVKSQDLTVVRYLVVTADQVDSRSRPDGVPAALERLAGLGDRLLLPFDRTVGDEVQALAIDAGAVVSTVTTLTRLGGWWIGIGVGDVERPLPATTREARGSAYVAAREAVEAARNSPTGLALQAAPDVGASQYGDVRNAEAALMLLRSVLSRRTPEGWELMDLLDADPSSRRAAATLGISPSAVSQRLARSARTEAQRGAELATHLLGLLLTGNPAGLPGGDA